MSHSSRSKCPNSHMGAILAYVYIMGTLIVDITSICKSIIIPFLYPITMSASQILKKPINRLP